MKLHFILFAVCGVLFASGLHAVSCPEGFEAETFDENEYKYVNDGEPCGEGWEVVSDPDLVPFPEGVFSNEKGNFRYQMCFVPE